MKIDKQKLVDLLVKKTGMDLDKVEEQLNELIGRIQEAAEKGKALEIKGFGMFYFSAEGDLKFDPSDDLQTEANYKYAGMEPVEIKKPRETSDEPVTESEPAEEPDESSSLKDDVWGFDEESGTEEDHKTKDKSKSKPADSTEKSESEPAGDIDDDRPEDKKNKEDEEEYDPFADFDHGYVKPEEEKSEEKKKDEAKEPVKSEKAGEKKSEELDDIFPSLSEKQKKKEKTEITPAGKKVSGRTAAKRTAKKNNPVFNLVALIVAVLVIIMGIIIANDLGYLDSLFGSSDAPAEVTQVEPQPRLPAETETPLDTPDEPETDELTTDEEIENEPVTQEQPDPPAIEDIEQPDTPDFGLYGTTEMIDDRYYSIILHSIRSENRAREVRDELQNEGYRSVITSVNSEDLGTMWRVGIGQFETISDAQNAAVELPQNYRDNHFIGLIQ